MKKKWIISAIVIVIALATFLSVKMFPKISNEQQSEINQELNDNEEELQEKGETPILPVVPSDEDEGQNYSEQGDQEVSNPKKEDKDTSDPEKEQQEVSDSKQEDGETLDPEQEKDSDANESIELPYVPFE